MKGLVLFLETVRFLSVACMIIALGTSLTGLALGMDESTAVTLVFIGVASIAIRVLATVEIIYLRTRPKKPNA